MAIENLYRMADEKRISLPPEARQAFLSEGDVFPTDVIQIHLSYRERV
jgi:hypothetical protein